MRQQAVTLVLVGLVIIAVSGCAPDIPIRIDNAVRHEDAKTVTEHISLVLIRPQFVNSRQSLQDFSGLTGDDLQELIDFAGDAQQRFVNFNGDVYRATCAERSSITTRVAVARRWLEMEHEVALFRETLVLELFDRLGEDASRTLVESVHAGRLDDRGVGAIQDIPVFYYLVDQRDPEQRMAQYCESFEQVASVETAPGAL